MNPSVIFILALVAATTRIDSSSRDDDQATIQGTWRRTGRDERYTLIFCGDVLIGMVGNPPLLGTKQSDYRLHDGSIDIEHEEGLQFGRYAIEGDRLALTLAATNKDRPKSVNEKPRWKYRSYDFERQR